MTKRTSINLNVALVDEAKAVLETKGTTETIHRALHEVVRQARLERLARRRFTLSDEELADMRRARTAAADVVSVRSKTKR